MSDARPTRRAVVAAAVLGGLAGCGLPGSSPVRPGLEIGAPLLPPVRFGFDAPRRGANREQIVRGFLAASWSADEDYRAARAYLTPEASRAWDPRAGVTVYPVSSSLTVTPVGGDAMQVSAEEIARLDASGRYAARGPGTTRRATIALSRASGEWRIARLPADFGMWLGRFFFERAYRAFEVAYVDEGFRTVVVDRRWFPLGAGLATTLARAQLDDVPGYLRGAARTGFPRGTTLEVDSVPVVGGTAEMDLDDSVLTVRADDRRAAWAQALTTMLQVPEVKRVVLQAAGTPLDVVGVRPRPQSLEVLGLARGSTHTDRALRRQGTTFHVVDVGAFEAEAQKVRDRLAGLPAVPEPWTGLACSADLSDLAAVGGDGLDLRRWRDGRSAMFARFATRLTPTAYDPDGRLWVGGLDLRGRPGVWVVDARSPELPGRPVRLATPWLTAPPAAVRPAADGVRVAVLCAGAAGRAWLGVAAALRGPSGAPTALTTPWAVGGDLVAATSLAWVDDAHVVVLGRAAGGAGTRPVLVDVGGPTTELAPLPDPRQVACLGGERGIVVVSGDGQAYGRAGGGWQPIGAATGMIVPGT